ncbi:MAG: acylphosphatase [Mesotoga sp.]|uniref:acylphosphatase n=1 Tax=unclassified Mesotoga TaxID=1184398 RepID=UPI000EF2031A|nr:MULTISPECIES: acylphosphatase [unclassified Mesotoga]MDI9367441.1 acylphosphatase [Thermotogota bacterium]NLT44404.1 acylphosphatase [Thermotogaceae bacterium]MDD2334631.1 acylphosphatase [Mesotoga sp.]MDD3681274.1 acylphosphatase [Mesotoga sp.]MDD4207905.1 acylphosphatase [Mesotoga sp.]
MITVEVILEGKVQKVGMRNYIRRLAIKHKIKGYVENVDNGSVRVVAQGSEEKLSVFLKNIEKVSLAVRLSGGKILKMVERPSCERGFGSFEKR